MTKGRYQEGRRKDHQPNIDASFRSPDSQRCTDVTHEHRAVVLAIFVLFFNSDLSSRAPGTEPGRSLRKTPSGFSNGLLFVTTECDGVKVGLPHCSARSQSPRSREAAQG